MRLILFISSVLLLASCKNKTESNEIITESKELNSASESNFEMYELSEMSLLMELMYADNTRLRNAIVQEEVDLGEIPSFYENIENAVLTEPSDRDSFFNSHSKEYLEAQRLIYEDIDNAKINFNKMVNSCIECHMVKCAGPIDRIKKLLIK